jgi:hypothetical protein
MEKITCVMIKRGELLGPLYEDIPLGKLIRSIIAGGHFTSESLLWFGFIALGNPLNWFGTSVK